MRNKIFSPKIDATNLLTEHQNNQKSNKRKILKIKSYNPVFNEIFVINLFFPCHKQFYSDI